MGIIDRIFGRGNDGIAAKALEKPAWWGNVWNTDTSAESGEYGDSPTGRVGAVKHNVWAYNCVQARMAAVAQAPMKLYRGVGDEKQEIEDHPVLDLLRIVNPVNLNARSFRRGIEQQLSLHGRCIIQKVRGVGGVRELYILPMNFLEVEEDAREWIKGFTWLPTNTLVPRADVIDINYPSMNGDVEADSPTSVALDSINRYNIADQAQSSIDKRGGQKGGMVIHPSGTIQADFDRARAEWDRWRKNPNNAGRDMHVSAGFDWRGDAFSSSEMQREERMHRIAKEIMAPYRVPPAAAGDFSDASVLANAGVQMRSLWDLFAVDECAFIAEELTYSLLHAEWPDTARAELYFEHDLSQIPAMREDNDSRVQRAIALNASNLASVNEARDIAGLEKSDDVAADRILMEASQADVVADPAPLMAIIQSFAAGAITEPAAATLLRIAAPNLTDDQVASLLTTVPKPEPAPMEAAPVEDEEMEDEEYADDEMDAFDAEDSEIDAEIDAILGEDAAKADGAFDEAKVERKGGQFAPKGAGESAESTPKKKRATTPEANKRMMDRRVSKAREVEASMTEDIARLDEAEANADDKLKKRIGKLRDRLKKRLTDAMTIIESNGATMPKRRRTSAVDKLLGSAEPKSATNDAVENLPVVKAVDASIDDPWTPPQAVQRAAEKGLKLREEFGRGGTMVGVARARDLSNGKRIPPETINRMLSYFARHEVDKQAEDFGNDSNPSPGYIAWLLWGGDAGQAWVNRIEREYPAETKALPYVDPVGLVAETLDGDELGIIEALHRGGVHDGVKASVKVPVFTIAGKAYASDEVMVRHA
jgi:HK97 family phage portal protein